MTSQHRKHRGYKTQDIVAQYLKTKGWAYAESTGAGRQGSDITGTPAIDWEVKAKADFNPMEAIKQMQARAKDGVISIAVLRPNGWGEANVHNFPAVVPLSVMIELLREAGYGDSNT
jgi:hypothetical protein